MTIDYNETNHHEESVFLENGTLDSSPRDKQSSARTSRTRSTSASIRNSTKPLLQILGHSLTLSSQNSSIWKKIKDLNPNFECYVRLTDDVKKLQTLKTPIYFKQNDRVFVHHSTGYFRAARVEAIEKNLDKTKYTCKFLRLRNFPLKSDKSKEESESEDEDDQDERSVVVDTSQILPINMLSKEDEVSFSTNNSYKKCTYLGVVEERKSFWFDLMLRRNRKKLR